MSSFPDASSSDGEAMPDQHGAELREPQFTFRNIGPITHAELSLGGLTVIAGRNNTGKTYLVYTLYGFLKAYRQRVPHWLGVPLELTGISAVAQEITRQLLDSGYVTYPLAHEGFLRLRNAAISQVAHSFSKDDLASVFSSPSEAFQDASLDVWLPPPTQPWSMEATFDLTGGGMLALRYDRREIAASLGDLRIKHTPLEVEHYVALFFTELLLDDLPFSPFILSAERFGISLFHRELDFTKNQVVDLLQKMAVQKDIERDWPYLLIDSSTSRYALPIKDNIDYTRSIPDLKERRSALYEDKMFDEVKGMMGDYYSNADGDIRFVSKARRGRKFNIPLHLASSSVRGLSDLYFFLRHVARKDQLLIIDEPESHLDTTNQREMARLLARFVRAGIKVLITTHSDYIIKEFNNLIMLGSQFENRESVAKRLGYSADEYLPQESVRAYVAEKNTLTRCAVDRFGMDMPVFDKSIDKINRVANELSSRVEEID